MASDRESTVNSVKAGLLTCNIAAVLPIRFVGQWTFVAATVCVTYSCATVRDLHTIPYYSQFSWVPYRVDEDRRKNFSAANVRKFRQSGGWLSIRYTVEKTRV